MAINKITYVFFKKSIDDEFFKESHEFENKALHQINTFKFFNTYDLGKKKHTKISQN